MGFTKLDEGIVLSSVWSEPCEIRVVWITLMAMADQHGVVHSSLPGLARSANVPLEVVVTALDRFKAPDPFSRTKDNDGRRIEEVDGGWLLLNYAKYRRWSYSDSPDAVRKRQKRTQPDMSGMSGQVPDISASASVSSSEFSPDSEQEGKTAKIATWRTSFEKYQEEEIAAYVILCNTPGYIAERKTFHPGLDIPMSLKKAHQDFWSKQAGWKNKKQSRSKTIDWMETYNNALSLRMNQVWLPKDKRQESQQYDNFFPDRSGT